MNRRVNPKRTHPVEGEFRISTWSASGKDLVALGATPNGSLVYVYNKTGEDIVQLFAEDYVNGVVGAWNRKGKGRTYDSK